jgi:hypothetical protein
MVHELEGRIIMNDFELTQASVCRVMQHCASACHVLMVSCDEFLIVRGIAQQDGRNFAIA